MGRPAIRWPKPLAHPQECYNRAETMPQGRRYEAARISRSDRRRGRVVGGGARPAGTVVGFLRRGAQEGYAPMMAAFRKSLSEAGYAEGQNVAIELRWAEGRLSGCRN